MEKAARGALLRERFKGKAGAFAWRSTGTKRTPMCEPTGGRQFPNDFPAVVKSASVPVWAKIPASKRALTISVKRQVPGMLPLTKVARAMYEWNGMQWAPDSV